MPKPPAPGDPPVVGPESTDAGAHSGLALREAAIAAREDAVEREWERLRYVLLAARMAAWEYDIPSDTATLSPSAAAYFGVEEDAAPRTFEALLSCVHPDDRALLRDAFAAALHPHPSNGPEFRVVWPDGTVHWIANMGRVWRDDDGVPRKMLGVIYSIDERKRDEAARLELERRVQHHQKLESLALLAGGVAHDFNNLLVGILGNASIVAMDLPPESPLRDSVEAIEKQARRAAELVRQLLAYTGRGHLSTEPADISALVREMDALLRAAIASRITLRFESAPRPVIATVDATQIRQVVMNLITNAADAIGDREGIISVRTSTMTLHAGARRSDWIGGELPDGEYAVIEVADSGDGMDPATQARIFDPFFTTKFEGRGLGLAATLGIVRGHRGAIAVLSAPERGTLFRVAIPLAAGATATDAAHVDPAADGWRGNGTALVIENDDVVRKVAATLLRRAGFDVRSVGDAAHAIETLRQHAHEIVAILLDRSMPGFDGPAAVVALHGIAPHVPIVLMTGYDEAGATADYDPRSLAGVLTKPFLARELNVAMKAALESWSGSRPAISNS
jgi:signal transduction histidine kinase/ActR/RegA family two-component response regulator